MSDADRYGPQIDDLYEEQLRELRAEGRRSPKPKPTGAVCSSCVPVLAPGPSGLRLRHAWDCDDKPSEPISVSEYAKHRTWEGRR